MNAEPIVGLDLEAVYRQRFGHSLEYRRKVWDVLVKDCFLPMMGPVETLVDVGCGYGDFVLHYPAPRKYGIDLNASVSAYVSDDVQLIVQDASALWPLPDDSVDLVFSSNFFEHLPSRDAIAATLVQAHRVLRPGGRILVMGPNVRLVPGSYWDFWDHIVPLSDRSVREALSLTGFTVDRVIPRFIPYTMSHVRPLPLVFLRAYLRLRPAWRLLGRQFLISATK